MENVIKRFAFKNTAIDLRLFLLGALLFFTAIIILTRVTTPYMAIATLAYALLMLGVMFRSRKKIHVPLMVSGVLIDLSLVAVLEINRSAIATAVEGSLNYWQQGHIAFSTLAAALYLPTMAFGAWSILKPAKHKKKPVHVYLGRLAFLFRTGGFLLMFSLLEHVKK